MEIESILHKCFRRLGGAKPHNLDVGRKIAKLVTGEGLVILLPIILFFLLNALNRDHDNELKLLQFQNYIALAIFQIFFSFPSNKASV